MDVLFEQFNKNERFLISGDRERATRQVLPVPLAADDGFARLRDIVRYTEGEVAVVLDRHKLYGDISTTDTNFQETTPPSIAAVDGEAARHLLSGRGSGT